VAEEQGRQQGSADAIGASLPQDSEAQTTPDEAMILAAAQEVCETTLGPNAEATDRGEGPNKVNFRALAEKGLLGLAIPREYGGLDANGATQRKFTQLLASY